MSFMNFLKEIENDKWSFSRISGFLLILFYIFGGGYIILTTKQFPDFPHGLAITVASLYGLNKFAQPIKKTAKDIKESINKKTNH